MSCCCPAEKEVDVKSSVINKQYADLKSGGGDYSVPPMTQTMKRGSGAIAIPMDDGSDAQAVDWWRNRSQETNQSTPDSQLSGGGNNFNTYRSPERSSTGTTQPMQLTPDAERMWVSPDSHLHDTSNKMATVESIEVDELSAVKEDLKRREIHDFMPANMKTVRAPSLPLDRSRTDDSAFTDESPLNFKLIEHEEEEVLSDRRFENESDDYDSDDEEDIEPMMNSPPQVNRASSSKTPPPLPPTGSSLHDLRHTKSPMVDNEIVDVAADYLAASDPVEIDIDDSDPDELDQIVMGVVRNSSPTGRREDAESSRIEDLLTGRRRMSPINHHQSATVTTVGSMSRGATTTTVSPLPPTREPVAPKRPPTPEEAAAAFAAAASQIRAPSPQLWAPSPQHRSPSPQLRAPSPRTSPTPRLTMTQDRPNHNNTSMETSDSLSTVPSNVDSETRERYLLACRLLKVTMIEKDAKLQPQDKEFLRGLLSTAEQTQEPSQDDIAAIETASDVLMSDMDDNPTEPQQKQPLRLSHIKEAWQRKAQELFARRPANTPGLTVPLPLSPSRLAVAPAPVSPSKQDSPTTRSLNVLSPQPSPRTSPFIALGRKPSAPPGVLTLPLMEALGGFLPYRVAEENFWLKYSLDDHGSNLQSLLERVKFCRHTIIGVETKDGNVFGAFCSSPWRNRPGWFGSGECFLWRLKKSRLAGGGRQPNYDYDNEMEVYPYTGHDEQIQYCTEKTLAVGGGEWSLTNGASDTSPHENEPVGIAFMLDGDLMGGETNSCATFANPRLCGKDSGSNEFDIHGLEVWTLTPCLTVADAQRLEDKHAFIEKNALKR